MGIGFQWRTWFWAMRWRLPFWGTAALCLMTAGARNDDGGLLAAGLLLVPGMLAAALAIQGVWGLLYLTPQRWPWIEPFNAFVLRVLAPWLVLAWFLGLAPIPPYDQRPVLRELRDGRHR